MIEFVCSKNDCSNKDVVYKFLGFDATAECGGCKEILTGTNETPDPEIQVQVPGVLEQE
jgi:hypothetical protein